MHAKTKGWALFFVLLGLSTWLTVHLVVLDYSFEKGCESYLKLAGDAPNVVLADEYLDSALTYIVVNNLTEGNSAFMLPTPETDLSKWYQQLSGAKSTTQELLRRVADTLVVVTQLEKDNALMKIREVVLDSGEKGTQVTYPENIAWFPHQVRLLIFLLLLVFGWGYFLVRLLI